MGFLVAAGCAPRPPRLVVVSSPVAETISLLGDTLYGLPLDAEGGPGRVRRISAARDAVARDSSDVSAWLRLGRSTAELGRMREAVGIFSQVVVAHFNDPRVYRERGEVLLRLRHLDGAIADLRKAGLLAVGRGPIMEAVPALESEGIEAPGIALTTTQYQAFLLQGVALYCKGNYAAAYPVLAEAAGLALTADERSRAMLWLFFALRRVGEGSDAKSVLDLVEPEWAENAHFPEIHLLLAYKGLVPSDSITARALAGRGAERALYSYGIAYFLQLRPERRVDAETWLLRAHSGGNWATLTYLAAEADLARLRGVKRVQIR